MEFGGIKAESKNKIVGILKVLFPEAKIYLYGSRARGDFRPQSDIDLAIDAGAGKERLRLGEAKGLMESLHIPQKIDLIDLNYASGEFRENILKDRVLWSN